MLLSDIDADAALQFLDKPRRADSHPAAVRSDLGPFPQSAADGSGHPPFPGVVPPCQEGLAACLLTGSVCPAFGLAGKLRCDEVHQYACARRHTSTESVQYLQRYRG